MGFKIQVVDRSRRPLKRWPVTVMWEPSGVSRGTTDDNGIYDTRVNSGGTIKYAEAGGERVLGSQWVDGNDLITVQVSR